MSATTTIFSHPELLKLHHGGYNPVILNKIQGDLNLQAAEMLMLGGNYSPTREELLAAAATLLPKGENLLMLYKEAAQHHSTDDPENLTAMAEHIQDCAGALEELAVKVKASGDSLPPAMLSQAEADIGRRWADLIDANEQVKARGGPEAFFYLNRISADERPEGPIGAFYDAAIANLSSRSTTETYQRERATG